MIYLRTGNEDKRVYLSNACLNTVCMKSVRTHTMVCVLKAPPASPQAARGVDVLCIDGPATIASECAIRKSIRTELSSVVGFAVFPVLKLRSFAVLATALHYFNFQSLPLRMLNPLSFALLVNRMFHFQAQVIQVNV